MLLHDIVTVGADKFASRTALIFRDAPTSYAELAVAVERLAAGFAELGIGEGDRIALLLPNCPPFVLAYYAASRIGAVVVPANPLLKSAELQYIWNDADIKLVLTAPPLLPNVVTAQANLPQLKHIVNISALDEIGEAALREAPGLTTLSDVMKQGAVRLVQTPLPVREGAQIENECAVIIYTSGTTGHPKGAMLSHRNLLRNVEQVQQALVFTQEDRFLTALPLFHSFAGTVCLNVALATGSASLLMESFVPARVLDAIEKHHVSIFPGVPAMYNALLNYPAEREYDLSSLRFCVSGGAPLSATTLNAIEARFNVPVLEGDGPTECSPVTSVNRLDAVRKVSSVGLPLPGVDIAIFDDNDNALAAEEVGEIVVRGDNVMLGYLNQPDATAEVMTSGWYHTGDIGKIDAEGYVYILDRKKDMIITAGLNVYPREIEDVLFKHAAVQDVAVVGMQDALRGEEVLAVVVKKPEAVVTERELIAHCRAQLANYKVPRKVLFREVLPRGGTGKVVKRLLKKELEMEG